MSVFTPRGVEDLRMMLRVLRCWVLTKKDTEDTLLNRRMSDLALVAPANLVRAIPRSPRRDLDLLAAYGWLGGRPLDKTKTPVVPRGTLMAELSADGTTVTECTIRVGLFRIRDDTTLHADGWRFELPDVARPGQDAHDVPHPYQHCQAIIGWEPATDCLLHPPHDPERDDACAGIDPCDVEAVDTERRDARDAVHVTHPAIPLPTTTLTGLAASVLTTLYGASAARGMLDSDATIVRSAADVIRTDLAHLHLLG